MTTSFKLRRGTAAAWTSANPVLAAGEPGIETDTKKWKVGDGSTAWNSLGYFGLTDISGKVDSNVAITGATKTKITYDAKGLVTAGADATTADIADSLNKRYVTDAELVVIGNTSGTNTGDQTVPAFATPAIALGSSAAAGAASTVIRSDGTIAAFDTTVPSTQAFGDAAAVGTAAFAARRDHTHAMPAVGTLGGAIWTTIVKSQDESVTSSAAFQADDELFFTGVSTAFYEIELLLIYASPLGAGTPDILFNVYEDGTTRGIGQCLGWTTGDSTVTAALGFSNGGGYARGTAAANRAAFMWGIYGPAAGGTVGLNWCQNTSGSNATIVRAGSILRYRRII